MADHIASLLPTLSTRTVPPASRVVMDPNNANGSSNVADNQSIPNVANDDTNVAGNVAQPPQQPRHSRHPTHLT